MAASSYDLVIVGGGLAGSALAKAMAERGAAVLVLEREREFRDRVRGEGMHPWGVAEARALGVYEALLASCAHEARWWATARGGGPVQRRDLIETTTHRAAELTFYHPAMQTQLLHLAAASGAEVLRGAVASNVRRGPNPTVTVRFDGTGREIQARLVVAADGRHSQLRRWAGFQVSHDPERLWITGVLLTSMQIADDTIHNFGPASFGQRTLLFPLGEGRVRAYFITARRTEHVRLGGAAHLPKLVEYCVDSGTPREWFDDIGIGGPLATFEAADVWVEHPYENGVVLVGDAAAASDPSWGCGLSLTLRDVRTLRDALIADDDWRVGPNRYAAEHDRYFGALHTIESWMTEILYGLGPDADRIRAHALPQLGRGEGPDMAGLGPDYPTDEAARVRLLGA